MDALWTLEELGRKVEEALSVDYEGPDNGQVSAVPNRRTIRYYATLGLLDRPAEMHGRTALYGRRHLLQLVAIKRLQAEGLSLAEVQERLSGLGDDRLAAVARLPKATARRPPRRPRRADFWRELPAEAAGEGGLPASPGEGPAPEPAPTSLSGVELAPGLTLLLAAPRPLARAEAREIRRAAAPLLSLLERRGLAPGRG